jgi:hypothetical protein
MKTTVQAKSTPVTIIGKVNNSSKVEDFSVSKPLNPAPLETSKAEIKEELKDIKPVLNLESTLKLVEELHRRKIQRDKLLATISTLEEFEVAQQDDAEETDTNYFQGCELTIQDDKRKEFSTKNPYIIKKVAEYINTLCIDRLAEIESGIYIPAYRK